MKEFYPGVRFYGHGNILRKYSKFPYGLPLPVSVQHGWMKAPIRHDARTDAAENWYWSTNIAEKFKEKYPLIKFRIVGAPFLYCLKNINYQDRNLGSKQGSIVFPSHSTDKMKISLDYEEYCYMLNDLPNRYKPITVCIYHNDRKEGKDSIFSKHGFKIVCNGNDPCSDSFLYNFITNVQSKRYFLTNEWSSAMHYASIMGVKVCLYGPKIKSVKSSDPNVDEKYFRECWNPFKEAHEKYYSPPGCDQCKQYDIAVRELGVSDMLSEMKMRLLLWRLLFTAEYFEKYRNRAIYTLRKQ